MAIERFTKDHEWIRVDGDIATVGITASRAGAARRCRVRRGAGGRPQGRKQGEAAAVVESVKAASDVYAPVSGEVDRGQRRDRRQPALVNEDAEGKAWFFKISIADPAELDADGPRRLRGFVGERLMRYLPLTDADRRAMLAKIGVADIDALFADVPDGQAARRAARPAEGQGRAGGRARAGPAGGAATSPAGSVPFFVGAGAYQPSRAGHASIT